MSTDSVVSIGPAPAGPSRRSKEILRRIKEQMGGQDITKQELGLRTGIHRVTVGRGLSGQRPFTVDELELVAEALDVDFDWLLTGYPAPGAPVPPAGIEPAAFCSEEPLLFPQNDHLPSDAEEHDWDAEVIPLRPSKASAFPASTVATI